MDNSHVALVSVELERAGFAKYRCDRPIPLGVNLGSLTKILKCAKDDDVCTLKAADEADTLNLTYEAKSPFTSPSFSSIITKLIWHVDADRISDYELKLMDIDSDTLGIPDTEYDVCVTMPSAEFARIVRDLSALGESVKIDVSKDGVRFSSEGESANGNILLKQTESAKRRFKQVGKEKEKTKVKKEDGDEEDEEDEPESEEEGSSKKKKKTKVKREEGGSDVEMEDDDEDDDEAKPDEDEDEDEDSESASKKRKKAPSKVPIYIYRRLSPTQPPVFVSRLLSHLNAPRGPRTMTRRVKGEYQST